MKRLLILLLLIILAVTPLRAEKWALLVGISSCPDDISPLRYCVADVLDFLFPDNIVLPYFSYRFSSKMMFVFRRYDHEGFIDDNGNRMFDLELVSNKSIYRLDVNNFDAREGLKNCGVEQIEDMINQWFRYNYYRTTKGITKFIRFSDPIVDSNEHTITMDFSQKAKFQRISI